MIHDILRMGDPRLLEVSQPVRDLHAPELKTLVADMFETMHAASGAGLAAPQTTRGLLVHRVARPGCPWAPIRRPGPDGQPLPEMRDHVAPPSIDFQSPLAVPPPFMQHVVRRR